MNHLRAGLLWVLAWGLAVPALGNTSGTVAVSVPGSASTVVVHEVEDQPPAQRRSRAFTLEVAIQASPYPLYGISILSDVFQQYRNADRYKHYSHDVLSYASIPISLDNADEDIRWGAEVYDYSGYRYFRKELTTSLDLDVSARFLHSSNGIYRFMEYQKAGGLTFASFGTNPASLRLFGKARYDGQFYGLLTEKQGTVGILNEAYAPFQMNVKWGVSQYKIPMITGIIREIYYNPVEFNDLDLNKEKSKKGFKLISSIMHINHLNWYGPVAGYFLSRIACSYRCEIEENGYSKLQGMYVDTGSGYIDPELFVGSFHLVDYRLDGKLVDWVGFLDARISPFGSSVPRYQGKDSYSPSHAMSVKVVGERYGGAADAFGKLSVADKISLVNSASTIANLIGVYDDELAVPLHVDQSTGMPSVVWADINLQDLSVPGEYRTIVSGVPAPPLTSGTASYKGHVSGAFSAKQISGAGLPIVTVSDMFLASARLDIQLDPSSPVASGYVSYLFDWGGDFLEFGALGLSGGEWNPSSSSFSQGSIYCYDSCTLLSTVNTWSAQFINMELPTTSSIGQQPDGMIGRVGAVSILATYPTLDMTLIFDINGIFALQNTTVTNSSTRPPKDSFFQTSPAPLVVGAEGRYNRKSLTRSFTNQPWSVNSIYANLSPRVIRATNGDFVHSGHAMNLETPLWYWRTADYGNCYCTMFISYFGFEGDGTAIESKARHPMGNNSRKYGYAYGMWLQEVHPSHWHTEGGDSKLGMFVDGTPPQTLPVTSTATYLGTVKGYAIPTNSTAVTDLKVIKGEFNLSVAWSIETPSITGHLNLDGAYTGAGNTKLTLSLGKAIWLANEKRFKAGQLECEGGCVSSSTHGSWEGLFVRTRDKENTPGKFVGGYAISSVEIRGSRETWDMFGWYTGQSETYLDRTRKLLNIPGEMLGQSASDGFFAAYVFATPEQRAAAVDTAGHATLGYNENLYGEVYSNGGKYATHTGFWTDKEDPTILGVMNRGLGVGINTMPTTGSASYSGNAIGYYASSTALPGFIYGRVSITMSFNPDNIVNANGAINFHVEQTPVRLNLTNNFKGSVVDGHMNCYSGCASGNETGKWAGQFVETSTTRVDGTAPGSFIGTFGVEGLTVNGHSYDALGLFTSVED